MNDKPRRAALAYIPPRNTIYRPGKKGLNLQEGKNVSSSTNAIFGGLGTGGGGLGRGGLNLTHEGHARFLLCVAMWCRARRASPTLALPIEAPHRTA